MVVSLEMVLPGLAGYWLDQQLGTVALFLLVGFAAGGTFGVLHLLRMLRAESRYGIDKSTGPKSNELN